MALIPVNSLQTADGQLVSLNAIRGALDAKPIPLDPGTQIANSTVSGSGSQLNLSLAATLGIGTIFGGAASAKINEVAFWQDACAYAVSGFSSASTNIVTQTQWGYGLRVFFRVQQLDTSFTLNYATLGAGVQYGSLVASYEVQTLGLGSQALAAILDGLSQFGQLTADTIRDLQGKVRTNLIALLAAPPPGGFIPRPFAVQLSTSPVFDPIVKARDEVFAMRHIRDGYSLGSAIQQAQSRHSTDVIKAVYAAITGSTDLAAKPSNAAMSAAKQWVG